MVSGRGGRWALLAPRVSQCLEERLAHSGRLDPVEPLPCCPRALGPAPPLLAPHRRAPPLSPPDEPRPKPRPASPRRRAEEMVRPRPRPRPAPPHSRCRGARSSPRGSHSRPGWGGRCLRSCSRHRSSCSLGQRSRPGRLGGQRGRGALAPDPWPQALPWLGSTEVSAGPQAREGGTRDVPRSRRPLWASWDVAARCQGLQGSSQAQPWTRWAN